MTTFRGAGRIGLPPSVKEGGKRVDFKQLNSQFDTDFDFLLETKCPRFAWCRAQLCPCVGFNSQTEQFDPNCDLCNGLGWHYFEPSEYVRDDSLIGVLDAQQEALIAKNKGVVIKALMTGEKSEPDAYAQLGRWSLGSNLCTVRPGNRLGYYDRLVALDDEMIFSEIIDADGTDTIRLRYPAVALNSLRSLTTIFGEEHCCLDAGDIKWVAGSVPTSGTRLTVHYICRPVWVVIEHTKLNRTSLVKFKTKNPSTPQGDILRLPPQALVRLEHLPMDPST